MSMAPKIGVRREDKSRWERRAPLTPAHTKELRENQGIRTVIQPSGIRIFPDEMYRAAGAQVSEDLSDCATVFAIKEIPVQLFLKGKAYVFFSHTIKGQPYNMPMLRRMMELRCQLIDYERIVDTEGKRIVAFGRFAGIAGMIDTLWAFGKRLLWKGIETPFMKVRRAYEYRDLEEAKHHIRKIGKEISERGVDDRIAPFVCGFAGYGNVSRGAQEIYDCLPCEEIAPSEVAEADDMDLTRLYKTVFREEHMVRPIGRTDFDLMDYYQRPEGYRSQFQDYIPHLTILMNCIYWDEKYPRILTKEFLRQLFSEGPPKLEIIGDISCDIGGAIECTVRSTQPEEAVYVYDPLSEKDTGGYEGAGVIIMAIDNLPCEIPGEASTKFSDALMPFVPEIAHADYGRSFQHWEISREIRDATILYHGELTPKYRYLQQFLRSDQRE